MSGSEGATGPPSGGTTRQRLTAFLRREEAVAYRHGRRIVHLAGALVLVYYLLPVGFFVLLPKEVVLLLALAAVVVIETVRLGLGADLPMIRGYEARRPASYVFFAAGLVAAVLLFPEPIAVAVVLGTAIVDPLAGELRARPGWAGRGPLIAFVAYTAIAVTSLALVGRWPWEASVALGALAGVVAVAVERWRFRWLDDDFTMTVVPAVVLYGVGTVALGLPR